jgi:hypothetical protein
VRSKSTRAPGQGRSGHSVRSKSTWAETQEQERGSDGEESRRNNQSARSKSTRTAEQGQSGRRVKPKPTQNEGEWRGRDNPTQREPPDRYSRSRQPEWAQTVNDSSEIIRALLDSRRNDNNHYREWKRAREKIGKYDPTDNFQAWTQSFIRHAPKNEENVTTKWEELMALLPRDMAHDADTLWDNERAGNTQWKFNRVLRKMIATYGEEADPSTALQTLTSFGPVRGEPIGTTITRFTKILTAYETASRAHDQTPMCRDDLTVRTAFTRGTPFREAIQASLPRTLLETFKKVRYLAREHSYARAHEAMDKGRALEGMAASRVHTNEHTEPGYLKELLERLVDTATSQGRHTRAREAAKGLGGSRQPRDIAHGAGATASGYKHRSARGPKPRTRHRQSRSPSPVPQHLPRGPTRTARRERRAAGVVSTSAERHDRRRRGYKSTSSERQSRDEIKRRRRTHGHTRPATIAQTSATHNGQQRPIGACWDFQRGQCTRGARCRFAHTKTVMSTQGSQCRDFQRGVCYRGARCGYAHGAPPPQTVHKLKCYEFTSRGTCRFGARCRYAHQ